MKEIKKGATSQRLRNFLARLVMIGKSKKYLENELVKVREKEPGLRKKISKERKAVSLINRAKRLR